MMNYVQSWTKLIQFGTLIMTLFLFACKEEDVPTINISATDFDGQIDENPAANTSLGSVNATANSGEITFSLTTQLPAGALSINAQTGELLVSDVSAFDFEVRQQISAQYQATIGNVSETANILININNVVESIEIDPFEITIDENPMNEMALGVISVQSDAENLSFALVTENVAANDTPAAFAITANTGELTVANSNFFNFEGRQAVTAQVKVLDTGSGLASLASITVNLNNVVETVSGERFELTIDENPLNGQTLGTVIVNSDADQLDYSLITDNLISGETPAAFDIDPNTGEISVADSSFFDFESRTTVTARYRAEAGGISTTVPIIISLNDLTEADRSALILTYEMVSTDLTIEYYADASLTYNFNVDWGDGTRDENVSYTGNALLISHTYDQAGLYDVLITGEFPGWNNNETGTISPFAPNSAYLRELKQWGTHQYKSLSGAFYATDNFIISATDNPDFSQLTDLNACFQDARNFSADISGWDVSNVSRMTNIFSGVVNFTADVSGWNTASLTDLGAAFRNAQDFAIDLNGWDVSKVTSLSATFMSSQSFNSAIDLWDVSAVTDMNNAFSSANNFMADISNWNVSAVQFFNSAFSSSPAFSMPFNPDISSWNTSSAVSMSSMFLGNPAFNQDISAWDVSNVSNFSFMFLDAVLFNQDISNWDTSSGENFQRMFEDAVAFNHSLGGWNISSATNMSNMLNNSGIVPDTYNAILVGWEAQANTPNGISLGAFGMTYYGVGETARTSLINNFNWQFFGDSVAE